MRPPGPEPWRRERSMPRSMATLRASGEAFTRAPFAEGRGAGRGVEGAPEEMALAAGAGAAGADAGWAAAEAAGFLADSVEPPSRVAMGSPTFTTPPSGMRISVSVPSSKASISIVALSVSTSAMTSPMEILSPVFLCHLTSVPSSMVSLNLGMVICVMGNRV